MSEARCGLVHLETMRLLAKVDGGDCDAALGPKPDGDLKKDVFDCSTFSMKLQVCTQRGDTPDVLWIRNDSHPQRSLCVGANGKVRWEDWKSSNASDPQWLLLMLEGTVEDGSETQKLPAACFLQNMKTGQFLAVEGDRLALSDKGEPWGMIQLSNALTPGETCLLGFGVTGGFFGAAVAGLGAMGASVAGTGACVGASAAAAAELVVAAATPVAAGLAHVGGVVAHETWHTAGKTYMNKSTEKFVQTGGISGSKLAAKTGATEEQLAELRERLAEAKAERDEALAAAGVKIEKDTPRVVYQLDGCDVFTRSSVSMAASLGICTDARDSDLYVF